MAWILESQNPATSSTPRASSRVSGSVSEPSEFVILIQYVQIVHSVRTWCQSRSESEMTCDLEGKSHPYHRIKAFQWF